MRLSNQSFPVNQAMRPWQKPARAPEVDWNVFACSNDIDFKKAMLNL